MGTNGAIIKVVKPKSMAKIAEIKARQILDSRGNPTIECDCILEDGSLGRAAVPSGASTGKFEAHELRDNDPQDFNGLSVHKAIANIETIIAPKLRGMEASDQAHLDQAMIELDGTPDKSKLGANALLAVSLAAPTAQAISEDLELFEYLIRLSPKLSQPSLPYGMYNILNGGVHAKGGADFQEFMVIPIQDTFVDRLRCAASIFHSLKKVLTDKNLSTGVGDEGGFAPHVRSNQEGFELIMEAIHHTSYRAGRDVFLAFDAAASEFYHDGAYHLATESKKLSRSEMIEYYENLVAQFPIISMEDPLDQEDFEGWAHLTSRLGNVVQIVGDDLYVTNPIRLQQGIDSKASNAILIKLNQIGTLSETIRAVELAQKNNFRCIVSHRSGETENTFIADLCVALGTGQIKAGSLSRSERLAKYNRLLEIEDYLNNH